MKRSVRAAVVAGVVLLAGWVVLQRYEARPRGEPAEPRTAAEATPAAAEPGVPSDRLAVPGAYRFAGIETVARVSNYADLVAGLGDEERRIVEAVYRAWGVGFEVR